jgi:glucosamine kinase
MTTPAGPAVLAVDSGGSGTRIGHVGSDRVVELPGVAWSSGDVPGVLAATVAAGWTELGRPETSVVALGVAATPVTEDDVARLARPLAAAVGAGSVLVANDAFTGHLGALAGAWGVSLVVGTGVACCGTAPGARPPVVVDGYGPLIGDLGSAFWIGRAAVRAALDARLDGRVGSPLQAAVEAAQGPLDGVAYRLHASPDAVREIAALAPLVAALAEDDPLAGEVLERAAHLLAATAIRAVGLVAASTPVGTVVPVALGGRVLEPGSWLAGRVSTLVTAGAAASVTSAAGTPLDGVARLAAIDPDALAASGVRSWTRGRVLR